MKTFMDISLSISIIQDVAEYLRLNSLDGIHTSQKSDGTWVTNVDLRVEDLVRDRLRQFLPQNTVWIGEETSAKRPLPIRQLREASTIVTIDGIDGTDYFIQHCQKQENDKWLAALTAVYQRDLATGLFDPVFAFAFQP